MPLVVSELKENSQIDYNAICPVLFMTFMAGSLTQPINHVPWQDQELGPLQDPPLAPTAEYLRLNKARETVARTVIYNGGGCRFNKETQAHWF